MNIFHNRYKYFIVIILLILLSNCKKEEYNTSSFPELSLKKGTVYTSTDNSVSGGEQITVGIFADAKEGENITNLIVKSDNERIIDEGVNAQSIDRDILITKNLDASQTITIIVRNKARNADSVSFVLTKTEDSFGEIVRHTGIVMGAQDNSSIGGCFSISNGQVYTLSEAFSNQSLIDLIYYYDSSGDNNTLASPGANSTSIFTGEYAPENWTTIQTTRYSRESLNVNLQDFDDAQNDSIIIANFFSAGGRKAKNLSANQVYGFTTSDGKFGLLRIKKVTGQLNGTIEFDLIKQK